MKTRLYICVSMLLGLLSGCQQPYEMEVDFALNREELRFTKAESKAYFLVYSTGSWTAEFETSVDWATISRTSGYGNQQIAVDCEKNESVSRGVRLIITNHDGKTKTVYLSQEAAVSEPYYKISETSLQLLAKGTAISLETQTNLPETLFSDVTIQVESADGSEWISDIKVTPEGISCAVADYTGEDGREALIGVYFPAAEWDESRCKSFLTIRQSAILPQVTLEESYVADPDGALTTVTLVPNWASEFYSYDMSSFSFEDSWILNGIYNPETQSISFTAEWNKTGQTRQTTLTCYVKDEEGNTISNASAQISQAVFTGIDPVDAVALYEGSRYANCHLIENTLTGTYWIDARRVDGTFPSEDMVSAEIVWQNLTCPVEKVLYKDGKIYFRTVADKTGNAVIAVRAADGNICWSWHIWVAGETVGTNTLNSVELMDRNVGATASTGKDSRGLNYEWGRKDPFPGAVHSDGTTSLDRIEVVPDSAIKNVKEQNGKTIGWTIQNPSSYVSGSDNSGKEDWYYDGSDAAAQNNTLWGNGTSKSIYDPCPYGYKVPSKDDFDAIVSEVKKGTFTKWDGVTLTGAFFPFSGWWQRKYNEVELCNVGTQGRMWSCTAHETEKTAHVFHYQDSNKLVQVQAHVRRWGCNVRCVKIK